MGRSSGRSRLARLVAVVAGASLLVGVMAAPAFAAAPIVTSFSPTSGPVGTTVTVNGDHFTGTTTVSFANVSAAFTFNTDNRLTATAPSGFTSGTIKVTNSAGTGESSGVFTVTSGTPAPVITSFTPTSGPVGAQVTINGDHFTGTTTVKFGSASATSFTVNNDNKITATVPTGATTGKISVTTPGGTIQSSGTFTVTGPVINSFSPTSGPVGTSVAIYGDHFTGTTIVRFGSTSASFTVNNDNKITATVPSAAISGKIQVTTPIGTAESAGSFTVTIIAHDRSVTLSLGGHLTASGQVFVNDGYAPCRSLVPVVIKRFVHGRWRWVATTATRPDGTYRAFIRDRPGPVRARALRLELTNGAICRAVRSPEVRP
jgi:hypothetical protein